jgi:hypothetical protein
MDPKESGAAGEDSARPGQAAKVPITPRKAAMPSAGGEPADPSLQLSPTSDEAVWERKNRIRPKSPKVPFDHSPKTSGVYATAPKTAESHPIQPKVAGLHGIPPKITPVQRQKRKRGILAYFLSRRKGRSRVWNLILLPAAIAIASLAIFFLFRFH